MPNYGKEYSVLKRKFHAEKMRHQKGKAGFGKCACEELAEEAMYQRNVAFGKGQMGRAKAFEKLAFGKLWPWKKEPKPIYTGRYGPDDYTSIFDPSPEEELKELYRKGGLKREDTERIDYLLSDRWGGAFGDSPRLWEMEGPFYNAGYRFGNDIGTGITNNCASHYANLVGISNDKARKELKGMNIKNCKDYYDRFFKGEI